MIKHESDLTEEEKAMIDRRLDLLDESEPNNEELPDEFDEEEGCVKPKE